MRDRYWRRIRRRRKENKYDDIWGLAILSWFTSHDDDWEGETAWSEVSWRLEIARPEVVEAPQDTTFITGYVYRRFK